MTALTYEQQYLILMLVVFVILGAVFTQFIRWVKDFD